MVHDSLNRIKREYLAQSMQKVCKAFISNTIQDMKKSWKRTI